MANGVRGPAVRERQPHEWLHLVEDEVALAYAQASDNLKVVRVKGPTVKLLVKPPQDPNLGGAECFQPTINQEFTSGGSRGNLL